MANTFSEVQAVRQITASDLKPRQMAVDEDGDRIYKSPNGDLIHFGKESGQVYKWIHERITVTPLPAGSTITITSEV